MVITIKAKSPGAVKAYYFDLEERRHDLGSFPRDWPNQVKKILKTESNHD